MLWQYLTPSVRTIMLHCRDGVQMVIGASEIRPEYFIWVDQSRELGLRHWESFGCSFLNIRWFSMRLLLRSQSWSRVWRQSFCPHGHLLWSTHDLYSGLACSRFGRYSRRVPPCPAVNNSRTWEGRGSLRATSVAQWWLQVEVLSNWHEADLDETSSSPRHWSVWPSYSLIRRLCKDKG